jgi:DNA (cytosine-5)-methyltransferase 1
MSFRVLTSLEICAGAGGAALGLERAGFEHIGLLELDPHACATLRHNRPSWNVLEQDVRTVNGRDFRGIDLLSGGVPCPPFSIAGKKLGGLDERDLFPEMLRLADEIRPRAVFIENVRGLLDTRFDDYRKRLEESFRSLGFVCKWKLLNASNYGVPQLRSRVVLVALKPGAAARFRFPDPAKRLPPNVGEVLSEEMGSLGWGGAKAWAKKANRIAPTLVGGSKLHGGPDLGPTRARQAWAALGVDGGSLANTPPPRGYKGLPKLTVAMTALIQGFPPDWEFVGKKTHAYRQVGNAFPPPVAKAVGLQIAKVLQVASSRRNQAA